MANSPSKNIRKIYLKQKRVELKNNFIKGLIAIIFTMIAFIFTDSLLTEEKPTDNT